MSLISSDKVMELKKNLFWLLVTKRLLWETDGNFLKTFLEKVFQIHIRKIHKKLLRAERYFKSYSLETNRSGTNRINALLCLDIYSFTEMILFPPSALILTLLKMSFVGVGFGLTTNYILGLVS